MPAEQYLVYCTCPDDAVARELAGALVERRLAACVNIVPGLTSVFFWEGEAQAEPEVLLLIKTSAAAYPALEQAILEQHPYELPEIVGSLWKRACPVSCIGSPWKPRAGPVTTTTPRTCQTPMSAKERP